LSRVFNRSRVEGRALRPTDAPIVPNDNDPADVPPATVGPPEVRPGDPDGLVLIDEGPGTPRSGPPRAMPWSGWPAEWATPAWQHVEALVDTAWMCLDLNSSVISTMPPYATTDAGLVPSPTWLENPDPDVYTSWNEFAKQLWWDYQMGEAFVLCTARYANGYPARFHVVEPWLVTVDMVGGLRTYSIGSRNVDGDLLHIRYKSTAGQCRGIGPLDAGRSRLVAAGVLQRYASGVVASGGVPYYAIKHPGELSSKQVADLKAQWLESRMSSLGEPAVLSGGIEIETLQFSPADMALLDLSRYTDSRIANLLHVPPFLVGLPSGGDSMTYSNTVALFDFHWRAGLKPMVDPGVSALSQWALPRGTAVELNRDEYVRPGPYERAQTWQILVNLGVLTPEQVGQLERFAISGEPAAVVPPTPAGALT
jgi:HK97 family phage portal protein